MSIAKLCDGWQSCHMRLAQPATLGGGKITYHAALGGDGVVVSGDGNFTAIAKGRLAASELSSLTKHDRRMTSEAARSDFALPAEDEKVREQVRTALRMALVSTAKNFGYEEPQRFEQVAQHPLNSCVTV